MPGGLPAFRLLVGSFDLTTQGENLTFSNADPGGHEIASFEVDNDVADRVFPGDGVRIMDGLGIVWEGRLSEPSRSIQHGWRGRSKSGAMVSRISAEGAGAAFKDNACSYIWVDQDLSRWGSWSIKRQIALITAGDNIQQYTTQIAAAKDDLPSLQFTTVGQIIGKAVSEYYYDAGPLNTVAEVVALATPFGYANPDARNVFEFYAADDNSGSNFSDLISYGGAGAKSIDFMPGNLHRYAVILHAFNQGAGAVFGDTNQNYGWYVQQIAVYGPHGLSKRSGGGTPMGFYTSDIALHAAQLALAAGAPVRIGQVDTMSLYVVPHYVQYVPVEHEQVISDMAKMAPAHYGVWESSSIFDDTPEFTFRGYSTVPNVFCSVADCDEVDVSERLADLYTSAEITYEDAAGTQYIETVTLPNYILDRTGVGRTFQADIGLSSAGAVTVFGSFVLQALFAQARSGGSLQLPTSVRNAQGGRVPAYRLKAGIDRIRVADLSVRQGEFLSYDTDGYRISRVECTVDSTSGEVTTRVEIDTGPQLVDTLQARMQIASNLGAVA